MVNPLLAVATATSAHPIDAKTAILATKSFGVGRGFLVLVVIFASSLALMILGGHLRASWQRKRKEKHP